MQVNVHNRSDLYASTGLCLIPEGIHLAELVKVDTFTNAFGERVGLVFLLDNGTELMQAAAPGSPRGKLAELLRGLGGIDGTLATARTLVGRHCRVAVRHSTNKAGKTYAEIEKTYA